MRRPRLRTCWPLLLPLAACQWLLPFPGASRDAPSSSEQHPDRAADRPGVERSLSPDRSSSDRARLDATADARKPDRQPDHPRPDALARDQSAVVDMLPPDLLVADGSSLCNNSCTGCPDDSPCAPTIAPGPCYFSTGVCRGGQCLPVLTDCYCAGTPADLAPCRDGALELGVCLSGGMAIDCCTTCIMGTGLNRKCAPSTGTTTCGLPSGACVNCTPLKCCNGKCC